MLYGLWFRLGELTKRVSVRNASERVQSFLERHRYSMGVAERYEKGSPSRHREIMSPTAAVQDKRDESRLAKDNPSLRCEVGHIKTHDCALAITGREMCFNQDIIAPHSD